LLAPDYVDHDAPQGTPPGPQDTKAFVTRFLDDYPDMHVTVEDILAESNKAAARLIWTGTNWHTGERYHRMGIVILYLNEKGQIVERWSAYVPLNES
jgi:predicted ester cyclase